MIQGCGREIRVMQRAWGAWGAWGAWAGIALATLASGAAAKDRGAAASPLLTALAQCRAVAGADERLRCYDAAAEKIGAAVEKKAVYVVDRSEVAKVKREQFGVKRPERGLPGVPDDGDGAKVDRIEGVIKAASTTRDGAWSILLADGSVWRQTDDAVLGREPRSGDTVVVREAAMGTFKMKIGGQSAIRVRRVI